MYKHFNVIWKGDWKQKRSIENKISLQMSEICGPSQKLIRWQMTRTRGHKGRITWEEKKVTGMAWGVLNEGSSMHCNEGVVSHFMRSWFGFRLDMAPCISIKVDFAAYFSSARRIKVDILQSWCLILCSSSFMILQTSQCFDSTIIQSMVLVVLLFQLGCQSFSFK